MKANVRSVELVRRDAGRGLRGRSRPSTREMDAPFRRGPLSSPKGWGSCLHGSRGRVHRHPCSSLTCAARWLGLDHAGARTRLAICRRSGFCNPGTLPRCACAATGACVRVPWLRGCPSLRSQRSFSGWHSRRPLAAAGRSHARTALSRASPHGLPAAQLGEGDSPSLTSDGTVPICGPGGLRPGGPLVSPCGPSVQPLPAVGRPAVRLAV